MKKTFTLLALLFCISLQAQMPCPKGINAADAAELKKLYTATNGQIWASQNNWNNPNSIFWYGVRWIVNQNECRVDSLLLQNNYLITKNLPTLDLPFLRYFNLSYNQLSGEIPDYNLPNLESFILINDAYTIPTTSNPKVELPSFSKLKKLKYLNISNHHDLKGAFPKYDLPLLEKLRHYNCSISGEIPEWNLPNLKDLALDNTLIESISSNLNLPSLTKLNLSNTKDLVSNYGFLAQAFPNLKSLNISAAPKISLTNLGFTFEHLEELEASENAYKGEFSMVNMPKLKSIRVQYNQLNRFLFLPDNVLENINIKANYFAGSLDFIEQFRQLQVFNASSNQFDTLSIILTNPNLTDLNLSQNKLQYGLAKFSALASLNQLNLSTNLLHNLSETVEFKQVSSINVRQNQLNIKNLDKIKTNKEALTYSPQAQVPIYEKSLFQSLKMLYIDDILEGNYYEWRKINEQGGGSRFVLSGTKYSTYIPTESGLYYCILTNPKFPYLTLYSEAKEVQVIDNQDNNFAVFPSLNDGNFAVFMDSPLPNEVAIKIYNEQGQLLSQKNQTYPQSPIIDFNLDLNNGIYFVEIQSNNKRVTRKIKVQH